MTTPAEGGGAHRGRGAALVAFDFSGTLTIAGPQFAADDVLADRLREAGLWELGIDSAELFWQRLVAPTWQRGSTTADGYASVLAGAAAGVLHERGRDVPPATIERATAAFAGRYFAHSVIAPQWDGFLQRLRAMSQVAVVIATDHYAEATAHITAELAARGVDAAPVAGATHVPAQILIANSADLGHVKATPDFWRPVRQAVGAVERLVLVDDFGVNEQLSDAYADREQVRRRRRATTAALQEVFGHAPHLVPFVLPPRCDHVEIAQRVDTAERSTMSALSDEP